MDLYLVRHAIAYGRDHERWPDDSKRPLTPEGEEGFRGISWELAKAALPPLRLFSSSYERAWRTAEVLREAAGWPDPEYMPALEPDIPPEKMALVLEDLLGDELGPTALVGHRPNLHELASLFLTGDKGVGITIKKGGALCIRFDGRPKPGAGELRWLLTPKILRSLTSYPSARAVTPTET